MTAEDVRSVTFEQVRKGYKPEDVDDFLLQVATDMNRLEAERDTALAEKAAMVAELNALLIERDNALAFKEDAEAKMYVLAGKVEEYRGQEETLKTALINAQRMGETVVYEAKQKADSMLRDATLRADMLRQGAEDDSERERQTLESLQSEVKNFKTTILNLYKQHIESLSALDPPVGRAEEALQANPARTQPTANEEAMADVWSSQENTDLSIEIPGPPTDEYEEYVEEIIYEEVQEEVTITLEQDPYYGSYNPEKEPQPLQRQPIVQPLQPNAHQSPAKVYDVEPYSNLP